MLLLLISCFSIFVLSKFLPFKPLHLQPWSSSKKRVLSILFWKELLCFSVPKLSKLMLTGNLLRISSTMPKIKKKCQVPVAEKVEKSYGISLLDLPDLVLESILEKLPPSGLCKMAGVCRSLRDRCWSDYFWERHMKEKWGSVIGHAAYREWQWNIASSSSSNCSNSFRGKKKKGLAKSLSFILSIAWPRSKLSNKHENQSALPKCSIMSWYFALESGKFWFPAQVYNREHGHVGFMLSCYDADLSYDSQTDTFHARYPPHGRRSAVIEEGVQWDRLRKPPVDTPPHYLHISDCLNDLRPGDHIEIQWRRNKEFPYGWWYGVVGHLDMCDKIDYHCNCHNSDTVILEFNQYTPGSRWTRATINRKSHREYGNEMDGFYGGIRKLDCEADISRWKRLWPSEVLA